MSPPDLPALPSTPGRRVALANRALATAWEKGWASVPSVEPAALVAKAARIARCDPDDDVSGWRARLDVLCGDLHDHARLTALGRTLAHGQLVSALAGRFRANALWRRHPEIARLPLSAPILVVGQMRSGTTRMQRLLACDPRLMFTRFYESWNPIPAGEGRGLIDSRKLKGWVGLTCARLLNPDFDRIHPTRWNAPDEEIGLHSLSIFGTAFEAQWNVPGYSAAIEQSDSVPVYREFRQLLQTLKWLRGDSSDRPWVLKVPQFAQDMDALLDVFPDARVIYLRRDPLQVTASSASLACNQMALQSDHVDPKRVGMEWERKVQLREARMAAAKAAARAPFVEVDYDAVERDWAGEMRRVYAMLALPFDDQVQAAMAAYLHAARQPDHARHRYDARWFGLDAGSAASR